MPRLNSEQFKELFKSGQRVSLKGQLQVIFKKNSFTANRFGYIIPKKIAKLSTVRNRAKRVLRESCRLNKRNIKEGFDMILYAYKPIESFKEAEKLVLEVLSKAKMLKKQAG